MECCWTLILSMVAGAVWVYYVVNRNLNYFKRRGIPYVEGTPLFGNMGPVVFGKLALAEHIQRLYNTHPGVRYVGIFDFMSPVVLLCDPEMIKFVTIKNFDNSTDHDSFMNETLDPLFAKSLFFLKGDRWRDMRSLLSPAFTSSKMKMMFGLVSQCGTQLAEYLAAKASQPIEMEMKDTFTRYTNDVIASSAFGIDVNSLRDRENEFYTVAKQATDLTGLQNLKLLTSRFSPFLIRLFNVRVLNEKVDKFFNHVIGSAIAMRDKEGITRNDMIQLMMQARDTSEKIKLTTEDMTAHAFIFLFGGFDTSSTLMSFVAHEVGVNPDVQEKLHAEIDAVLAESTNGEVTYESLHGMRYLDAVIREALRLYAPFPVLTRVCTKAFELPPAAPGLRPFTVEVGAKMWLPYHGVHRDPQYFPNPDKFDPERFSDENKGNIPTSAYLPFGIGPRVCIAGRFALMETKVALFHLFANCELSPCSRTSIPMELDRKSFTTTAENGFWLKIQRRF